MLSHQRSRNQLVSFHPPAPWTAPIHQHRSALAAKHHVRSSSDNPKLRASQTYLPTPLEDEFGPASASTTFASSSTASSSSTDRTTPPSSPSRMRVSGKSHSKTTSYSTSSSSKATSSSAQPRKSSALHARTSTPALSTVLPSFLAQSRCARCTVKIVYVSKHSSTKPQRALVRWGAVPYFTTAGKPAEFIYHTFEQLSDLRPELVARWDDDQKRHRRESGSSSSGGPSSDWANDKRRDSWVIEQLAYWVEFLNEWKFYREYYVFREELFGGEIPEVPSPECEHCGRRKP